MALYEMQRKHGLLNCQIKVILQCLLPDDFFDPWIFIEKRNSEMYTIALNCQIKVILQCLLPDDLSDSWISSKKRNSQMCTIVYFYHLVK